MSRTSQPLSFEFVLLGFLAEQPMHGYDLYKLLNTDPNISQIWQVKQAMLYAMLDKLEDIGFLSSETINQESYPNRKQYSLTESGLAAFEEWRSSPVDRPRDVHQEFLVRFYFAYRQGRNEARQLLIRQKQTCLAWLDIHQQHIAETGDEPFSHYLVDFKQSQLQSILDWVNYCLESMPS